jgi:hypothetical protein
MDDAIEFEGRERPVDRRPRRFHRIALAAKFAGDAPADFETRPARRKPRPHPPDESSAGFFLDHEHAEAVHHPMPGHDGGVAPADQFVGDGLAVGLNWRHAGSEREKHRFPSFSFVGGYRIPGPPTATTRIDRRRTQNLTA